MYIYIYYILNYILYIYINKQWAEPDWVRLGQALAQPSRFQAFQNWAQALGQEKSPRFVDWAGPGPFVQGPD